jgi:hypothetical protein
MHDPLFITHAGDSKTVTSGPDSRHFGHRSMSYERRGSCTGGIADE